MWFSPHQEIRSLSCRVALSLSLPEGLSGCDSLMDERIAACRVTAVGIGEPAMYVVLQYREYQWRLFVLAAIFDNSYRQLKTGLREAANLALAREGGAVCWQEQGTYLSKH